MQGKGAACSDKYYFENTMQGRICNQTVCFQRKLMCIITYICAVELIPYFHDHFAVVSVILTGDNGTEDLNITTYVTDQRHKLM